LQNFKYRKLK